MFSSPTTYHLAFHWSQKEYSSCAKRWDICFGKITSLDMSHPKVVCGWSIRSRSYIYIRFSSYDLPKFAIYAFRTCLRAFNMFRIINPPCFEKFMKGSMIEPSCRTHFSFPKSRNNKIMVSCNMYLSSRQWHYQTQQQKILLTVWPCITQIRREYP